jgi:hypothetical protein
MKKPLVYIAMRVPQGFNVALPNVIPAVLDCIVERGRKLEWRVINYDVILKESAKIENFEIDSSRNISWETLKSLLGNIVNVNEITICSMRGNFTEIEITDMIQRRDWLQFEICIDLFDSTEWIIFSQDENDLVRILQNSRIFI